jgi:hypothetical protein
VLLQGFFRESLPACGVFVSTGIGDVPAGLGHAHMTRTGCVRCTLGGVAVRRAPKPGPIRGDRGELSDSLSTRPRRPFAGRRVRFLQPPIDQVADCGFLIELLSGDSSGRPCPVR